jgi:hypothetical protein
MSAFVVVLGEVVVFVGGSRGGVEGGKCHPKSSDVIENDNGLVTREKGMSTYLEEVLESTRVQSFLYCRLFRMGQQCQR